jgi:hypothetical protein
MNNQLIPTWKKKDGTEIEIRKMSEEHIKSCIKILSGKSHPEAKNYLKCFENELKTRGTK